MRSDEFISENLKKWFKEKWVRFGPDGKIRGDCARGSSSEGKPKCLPQAKAQALGKKGRASSAAKKRREDPNPERRGPAKNVATKVKETYDLTPYEDGHANGESGEPYENPHPEGSKSHAEFRQGWREGYKINHPESTTEELDEACWKGYHKEGMKTMFGKKYPNCVKNKKSNEDVAEGERVARKSGQPANSKQHSDLYTDENPKGTITGLKFATVEDARASVSKIRNSGRSHAHKIQAAVAMEQRARAAGKASAAAVYRRYINANKKTSKTEGVAEGKIKLYTDPDYFGAEVDDYKASGPIVNISANRLIGFEPDDKMNQPASKANVEKIVAGLKQGDKLPPLLVRKYKNGYQVLDGHHRFLAYKLLGAKSIPAQVVPDEDIEEKGQQGVAEGHADQQRKIFKRNGKPVGEVGIDRASSPGVGQYYMKHYASGKDLAGYDSYEEAVAELKHFMKQGVAETEQLAEKCWDGYSQQGMKKKGDRQVPNCVPVAEQEIPFDQCPSCGGSIVHESELTEKQDACYHKVKSRYKVWPSAYASGALVQCRKKGAANWGNKNESMETNMDELNRIVELSGAGPTEQEQEFDLIESIIDDLALRNGVDAEAIWEDLETLTDDELYVFAVTTEPVMEDWQKANKKDRTAGMSQKAVNAYRRENPGSKLKTAVTTKPSKLKKGSKASKRRKSYCSRSKGQMKMHNISCAKTPDKAICKARRRWNC